MTDTMTTSTVDTAPLRATARRHRNGFQGACAVTLAVALALLLTGLLWPVATGALLSELAGHPTPNPTGGQSLALVLIMLISLGAYAAVFRAAARVSARLLYGDAEAAGVAAQSLSRWLWVMLFWSIGSRTLATLVATATNPPGERVLSIALGAEQAPIAIAAVVATFLARVLVLGAALWRDHREII